MITFLLLAAASVPVLAILLTYTLFCYEETNQSGRPLGHYLRLAARTALRSAASEALIILLHPLGLRKGLWSRPEGDGALVVLVHGLFHNQGAWVVARRRLMARGLAPACFAYASWGADWEPTVERLAAYLQQLLRDHPGRAVHLVGHSMGGLLLREALAQLPDSGAIRTLTTLGTPFGGSKLSPFALTSLGRHLTYGGDNVRRIAALPAPAHVRALALSSPADNMVLPNSALRCGLPGWTERQTRPVSHVAMLHDGEVLCAVLDWVEESGVH